MKTRYTFAILGVISVGLAVGGDLAAQNALVQVGSNDAQAHQFILSNIGPGYVSGGYEVDQARAAFRKLPPAGRTAVVNALYAWTKSHVTSPAFRQAYAQQRDENTPVERKHEGTVDQEVQARINQLRAEADQAYKELVAAGMKDQAEQLRKMSASMIPQPQVLRLQVEEERTKDAAEHAKAMAFWKDYYPPDPLTLVAKHLRSYIANTADVDFGAKQEQRCGEGGCGMAFVNDVYNQKSHHWKLSFEFGPEVTAAARAAAAAWLKELGTR